MVILGGPFCTSRLLKHELTTTADLPHPDGADKSSPPKDTTLIDKYSVVKRAPDLTRDHTVWGTRHMFSHKSEEAVMERVTLTTKLSELDATRMMPAIRWYTDCHPRRLELAAKEIQTWRDDFRAVKRDLVYAKPIVSSAHKSHRVLEYALQQKLVELNKLALEKAVEIGVDWKLMGVCGSGSVQ